MKGNFSKIFLKFNFKASQGYFIWIDLRKKNIFIASVFSAQAPPVYTSKAEKIQ